MINEFQLIESLNLLCYAKNNLNLKDYVNIWGKRLGEHIWRQEGNDILRIWESGLTLTEKEDFLKYILKLEKLKNEI